MNQLDYTHRDIYISSIYTVHVSPQIWMEMNEMKREKQKEKNTKYKTNKQTPMYLYTSDKYTC